MRGLPAAIAAGLVGAIVALAQPAAPAQPAQAQAQARAEDRWAGRLKALDPANPQGYLLLAEEVAEGAADDATLALARRLYLLAFSLSSPSDPSALLGLAALDAGESNRRWLRALAASLDARYDAFDWNAGAAPGVAAEVAYRAATVMGLARAGEAREARRVLERPGVAELLRRYERAIGTTGYTGALTRLERALAEWPCRECGNARVVSRPGPRGVEIKLCPVCSGNPGPRLSAEELLAQLRFEAMLLSGIQRSWAAQLVVDQDAPLRDPDPSGLASLYPGLDAGKPIWNGQEWVAAPAATPAPSPRAPSRPEPPAPTLPPSAPQGPAKEPGAPSDTPP